jgi:hypothetical protein
MGQYAWVFDVTLLVIMLGITYAVGSEGVYGAALMFINVVFAGLMAFSIFEPCARWVAANLGFMAKMADFVVLLLLFAVFFTIMRLLTDMLGVWYVRFHGAVDQIGRYVFGAATAWYLVGMFVCMVQTAPIHKKFLGYQWATHSFWTMGIDRFWLGFVQDTTYRIFEWEPPRAKQPPGRYVFDRDSDFILRYHNFRPFGQPDQTMPGVAKPAAAAGGAEQPAGGAQPAGAAAAGNQGGRPPVAPPGIQLE